MSAKAKHGVVLVNVGTPDEPTVPAVRRYLAEFLGDPRVVDLPRVLRWLLLHLVILPFRPRRSAHAYRQVWTKEGSPLLLHTQAQAAALAKRLPEAEVVAAMRYGNPSLRAALAGLRARGVAEVTLVPLYPQRAEATTGTTVAAFTEAVAQSGAALEVTVVPPFFAEAGFVEACAAQLRTAVAGAAVDHVVFSYHGLPLRQVKRACAAGDGACPGACEPLGAASADCYRAQCFATSRAIAAAAGVAHFTTAFQSRLKGTRWIGPFTDDVLAALPAQGARRVAVACPSFVADCLETLEELGQRGRATFLAAGGTDFVLVPAPNAAPAFIDTLAALVTRHGAGAGGAA